MNICFIVSIILNVVLGYVLVKRRNIGMLVIDIFDGVRVPYLLLKNGDVIATLKEREKVVLTVCRTDLK